MGAGSERAGSGSAGYDAPDSGILPVKAPPVALRFEGSVKDWVKDTAGNYRSVTSTEQGMILSICVSQGQIKSSPKTGHTLREIKYLGANNLKADVENRVRNSNPAKRLVAAGKAEIIKIVVDVSNKSLVVQMYFKALDAPNSPLLNRTWSN